jgi:hypothetical protein
MAECFVYLVITGAAFDPIEFQKLLAEDLAGEIGHGRNLQEAQPIPYTWKSERVALSENGDIGEALEFLFKKYNTVLQKAQSIDDTQISAQAVYRYVQQDGPRSVYLSSNLIAFLSEFKADFDFDVY